MPPPPDSTPPGRLRKDDNVADTLHGIAIRDDHLWSFGEYGFLTDYDDGTPVNASTLIDYYFLGGTENQKRAVRSTIEKRLKPPRTEFVTWEDCANVKFRQVPNLPAHIRITFGVPNDPEDFRSAIGALAIDDRRYPPNKPSMWLVGLPDKYPPTKFYRGTILHEFGHALGLYHEHQSPTLEGYLGRQLDEAAIIAAFGEQKARNQILTKPENPFNYTRFDKDSIMLYGIEKGWQVHPTFWDRVFSKATGYNLTLSKLDQAFIRLLYPPDLSIQANKQPFLQAMVIAGVPANAAGRMLDAFLWTEGTLPQRLRAMREQFNTVNQQAVRLWDANETVLRSIDPISLRRSGVTAFVGEVTKNKLFQTIVKNIVYRTVEQSGIPINISLPGSNQNEVKRMLGALAMHDSVGYAVKCYDDQLGRKSDVPKPSKLDDKDSIESPKTPQFDSKAWIADAGGYGTASVTKSKDEKRIIIDAWNTADKKALLTWKEGSPQFNSHNIDAKGLLHYKDEDLITAGTKAKWSLGGVAFYHDDWKVDNITAFFSPTIHGYATETDLRSDNELFENVKWESKHLL